MNAQSRLNYIEWYEWPAVSMSEHERGLSNIKWSNPCTNWIRLLYVLKLLIEVYTTLNACCRFTGYILLSPQVLVTQTDDVS